ncbi:iron-siderophore ABC transporter substrate-binding protein [Chitinilyticum litopenaei]|uniref:iron-siderophore ABC transporter substrate-binding protein n=1 Tax=Chitinilyticum litopenaei TaxID=1121276 RepID=UPI0003F8FD0B|nr:iron-siderophore ABC transporter substrate-binding protein [Chitinilyticum litopenaei]
MHLLVLIVFSCLLGLPGLSFAQSPRVIALSWEASEYLLALGVTPLAIADRDDYRHWVVEPPLPAGVLDAGSRLEPNLERIHALKPELIIINPALAGMQPTLQRIAPTLLLDAFRADHDNAQQAERLQRQLAQRLGRLAQHEAFLRAQQQKLARLRAALLARHGATAPAVCIVRFASATSFWAYGENSLPQAALQALGLRNACPQPRSAWGARLRKIPDLQQVGAGTLLHVPPFDQQAQLARSPLWQSLEVVKAGRFHAMAPVWTNGGLYSIGRLAEAITAALATP